MNALPVAPETVISAESRARYFDDMERWGFDIAYNAFYAHSREDLTGRLQEAYQEFASEAHRRGYPACIQIQSTVCAGDTFGIEEAQYDLSNNPERFGDRGFFASFSSDIWKGYLREVTDIFVKNYGYDYVVYEEPMYRVDIPGTKDRFHARFMAQHPDLEYPESRAETTEYLQVQRAKSRELASFYSDLALHAKAAGAQKVGVMPWFFTPTIENTPHDTLNTSCDLSRIAQIPDVDIIVVRMQPDNIACDVMRTSDDLRCSPKLYYTEVLAHALGKDVIAVSNPTDEHTPGTPSPLIPIDFFREATLCCLAAAPSGFTRHWYGKNYGEDDEHMDMLAEAAACASKLGQPVSSVAFVFSAAGTWHAEPLTCETVFTHYWAFTKQVMLKSHLPILTFHAETLGRCLAQHPEVRVLVFEEHFPLGVEQLAVIRDWWQGPEKRAIVAFGSGLGFSADLNRPGGQPLSSCLPGVLELIRLKQEAEARYASDQPVKLKNVSRVKRSAFLGDEFELASDVVANLRRVFGSRASVLYEADLGGTKIPVIAEWRDRTTLALFCGFGISDETAPVAEAALKYVLRELNCPPPVVSSCSDDLLWNINRNDFLILSNASDKPGFAVVDPGRATLWDCRKETMLPDQSHRLEFEPHSFQIYRVVGKRSKFLDLIGACCLRGLIDGSGRAEMEFVAGRKTVLVLRASPKEVIVDGKPCTISEEVVNGAYHVTLQQCPPGERHVTLRW